MTESSRIYDVILRAQLKTGWTGTTHSALVRHLEVVLFCRVRLVVGLFQTHLSWLCLGGGQILQRLHVIEVCFLLLAQHLLL